MIAPESTWNTDKSILGKASVRMPGTCGELVQGSVTGVAFHVSCPVDIFSTVSVTVTDATADWVFPADSPKAAAAIESALNYLGATGLGGCLSIASPLPRSKGMASSTADIAGAIFALARSLGRRISPTEAASLALGIEPTDGSIFPGIALFDHRQGAIREQLGPAPAMEIVILDCGGAVDTVVFNRQNLQDVLARAEPAALEALELVREGLRNGNLRAVGKAATLSAMAHQAILHKPSLEQVIAIAEGVGALGVNVGHSGTVLGVLIDPKEARAVEVAATLKRELPHVPQLGICHLIGGGCREHA